MLPKAVTSPIEKCRVGTKEILTVKNYNYENLQKKFKRNEQRTKINRNKR